MTEAGGLWDVVVVGATAPGDAARLALALALERRLDLHGGEIQRGLLRGELVAHRALAREAAEDARTDLAQLGAVVEVRVAKPARKSGEVAPLAGDPAGALPEPPPFAALEADPERDRPLRLSDLDGPPLPTVEPDRSRPQGRPAGVDRPFEPVRRPTPADLRRPTPSGSDPRRAGASKALRRPTPMLGPSEARRAATESPPAVAPASGRRPTPASISVAGEVDTSRPPDPFAPRIDPIVAAEAAASRSTVEVPGEPSVEAAQQRPTAEVAVRVAASPARVATPVPTSRAVTPVPTSRAETPSPRVATPSPTSRASASPAIAAAAPSPAPAAAEADAAPSPARAPAKPRPSKPEPAVGGAVPARFSAPAAPAEEKLELDLEAVRAARPVAPEPSALPPVAMPSASSMGWSVPTAPHRLLGSDPIATWLFALAIGFLVGLVVAFGVARARARTTVDPLEVELAEAYLGPTEVELGERRPPEAIESERREALAGVGLRFWLVWLGVSAPAAAALAMIKRP